MKKQPKQPKTITQDAIEKLKLKNGTYVVIGREGVTSSTVDEGTWVNIMVVNSSTWLYLTMTMELSELPRVDDTKHRMVSIAGPNGSAHGGSLFVLETSRFSSTGMDRDERFDFLVSMLEFQTVPGAVVSINILAYLASNPLYAQRFESEFTFDWVKSKTARHTNLGPSLFEEPSFFIDAIVGVNVARENKNWTKELDERFRVLRCEFKELEKTDSQVIEFKNLANNPNYLSPFESNRSVDEQVAEPVLFQTTVEPDASIVADYDPNLNLEL